jgi:hypothetical protein
MTALLPTVLHQRDVQRLLDGYPLPTRSEFHKPEHVPGLYVATVPVKSAAEARGLLDRLVSAYPDAKSMNAYPTVLAAVKLTVADPNTCYPRDLPADLGETQDLHRREKTYDRLKVIPSGRSRVLIHLQWTPMVDLLFRVIDLLPAALSANTERGSRDHIELLLTIMGGSEGRLSDGGCIGCRGDAESCSKGGMRCQGDGTNECACSSSTSCICSGHDHLTDSGGRFGLCSSKDCS